jgi:hypothetical protein
MRFARGDVRDHIDSHKRTTDLRIGAFPDCKAQFIPLVICPTGYLLIGVSSPLAKYFSLCSSGKSSLQVRAIPSRKRGVGHRHERWARDAVDAAASGAQS